MYFEINLAMYAVLGLLFLEGVSNYRIPVLVGAFRKQILNQDYEYVDAGLVENAKYNIESERIWRIFISSVVFITYFAFGALWFVPWFMGFTIVGAGLSGICPVLFVIHWFGFK